MENETAKIIHMEDPVDWYVMNSIKKHINNLKTNVKDNSEDIAINEMALRSFHSSIQERSAA